MTITRIDAQYYELTKAVNRIKDDEPFAQWVLFAVARYIDTGRASGAFVEAFCTLEPFQLTEMIRRVLVGDKSDEAIIRKVKRYLNINKED